MKANISILGLFFSLLFLLASCGEEDVDIYPVTSPGDSTEEFEALLLNSTVTNLTITKLMDGEQKPLGAIVALAGAPRSSAVNYTYEIIEPTTIAASAYQSSGTGSIPSGELTGQLPIMLDLDQFEIGVPEAITIRLTGSNEVGVVSSNEVTYNFAVVCPSDLAGTYTATTTGSSTDGCCPGEYSSTATVTVSGSGGSYTISDFSAGLYLDWYGVYGITAAFETDGRLSGAIVDICGDVSGTFGEPFGSNVTLVGSSDASTGVITYQWTNGFGDTGLVTLTPQ